mmetsp:Transcript_75491/g.208298  ORF Transcript_75491/g.208298 Transcript_75491/m.208298 type:complete len:179 (-) Transcript_75491:365-901(-)
MHAMHSTWPQPCRRLSGPRGRPGYLAIFKRSHPHLAAQNPESMHLKKGRARGGGRARWRGICAESQGLLPHLLDAELSRSEDNRDEPIAFLRVLVHVDSKRRHAALPVSLVLLLQSFQHGVQVAPLLVLVPSVEGACALCRMEHGPKGLLALQTISRGSQPTALQSIGSRGPLGPVTV